ncbi:MAG: glutamine amidotransferase [Wolbachia endosymbiont of Tyrophagus putrescentiae]|nr:glutamine amidotransferase [Wolbachia endosymbiont of Tyrophagus putrescentiae]
MLYKYCHKIINLLLIISLLNSNLSYTFDTKNNDIVVVIIKISNSYEFDEIFNNFGVKTASINCSELISLEENRASDQVKAAAEKFIKEHKINRIFIPYTFNSELFPSLLRCQLVVEAVMKIVDDDPSIHLLGNLQNIIHAKKIDEREPIISNLMLRLKQVKIVPNSHLAKVVSKFSIPDENGWFSMYYPHIFVTPSAVVDNTLENRKKLELLEYKVVGFSTDGAIEAIEDKHGNIYFYSNPLNSIIEKCYLPKCKAAALIAISVIHDFLYRPTLTF